MVQFDLLRRYFDAADVCEETIRALADLAVEQTFEAGEVMFREDQKSDHLYVMTTGHVDVQYLLRSGKRATVDTLLPGDFGVWSAVIKPHTTSSIGICRVKTQALVIEAAPLRALCEKDPRFGYRLVSQLAQAVRRRLQGARFQLADLE
jgi:CRP-like cAMP-binding protein